MDQAVAAPVRTSLSLEEGLLVAVAAILVALKFVFTVAAAPIADEAYYWMWGQHLAIGYFDHPPLAGWVQGTMHLLLGRSLFALRLTSVLAFAGTAWIFLDIAKRIGGDDWRRVFLRGIVIYIASPVFGWLGSIVFTDYLMIFLMLASGYLFFRYFSDFETTGKGEPAHLFGASVLLGLAALTKYPGAYLGIAVLGMVLTRHSLWPLLRGWQIYAAGALALAMQAPVLIWNIQHDFASLTFHATTRFERQFTGLDFGAMRNFILDSAGFLSPFLFAPIFGFFLRRQQDSFQRIGKTLSIWVFWLSTLTFLYISHLGWVLWWWNIAAYVLFMPFLGRTIDRLTLVLHVLWGGAITTALFLSFSIMPITMLVGGPALMESETAYDFARVAAAARAAEAAHGAGFLAANRYQTASRLGFELDDGSVDELSNRRTAFDDWSDREARRGQDAIVIVDERETPDDWRTQFTSIESVGAVTTERFGYQMVTYELYLGRDYQPTMP